MLTPLPVQVFWSFQTLLYKPMENAKNQKFEFFLYYGQNVF